MILSLKVEDEKSEGYEKVEFDDLDKMHLDYEATKGAAKVLVAGESEGLWLSFTGIRCVTRCGKRAVTHLQRDFGS